MPNKIPNKKYDIPTTDLEKILDNLNSDENRIKSIELLARTVPIPQRYIDTTIESYIQKSKTENNINYVNSAAGIAGIAGMKDKAQQLYVLVFEYKEKHEPIYEHYVSEAHNLQTRGLLAKAAGNQKKAQEYFKKYLEKETNITSALHFAQEQGMTEEISQLQEKKREQEIVQMKEQEQKREYGRAGHIARRLGMNKEAMQYYEKAEWFRAVAEIAEEVGEFEKAISNYERAKDFEKAIIVATKAGLTERAKRISFKVIGEYETDNKLDKAAEIADKIGMCDWALELYERAGHLDSALQIAQREKMGEKVQQLFPRAIDTYSQKKPEIAARILRRFGKETEAQLMYTKAIDEYESKGISSCSCCTPSLKKAAEIAQEAGMMARAEALSGLHKLLSDEE